MQSRNASKSKALSVWGSSSCFGARVDSYQAEARWLSLLEFLGSVLVWKVGSVLGSHLFKFLFLVFSQIFEKALDEPKYSSMYAQLCRRLAENAPNFDPLDKPCTFKRLLLNKCKDEFENRLVWFIFHHDPDQRYKLLTRKKLELYFVWHLLMKWVSIYFKWIVGPKVSK